MQTLEVSGFLVTVIVYGVGTEQVACVSLWNVSVVSHEEPGWGSTGILDHEKEKERTIKKTCEVC